MERTIRAADYWNDALTVQQYLDQMPQRREEYEHGIATAVIPADARAAFSSGSVRILVLTEDYCGDSAQFIPPVVRLAQELENVEIRFLLRNSHRDLAAGYLRKDGYQPIPVLILLDENGAELGTLIERPLRMYDEMAAETRRFALEHPELEGANRNYQQMPPETLAAVIANMEVFRTARAERYLGWLWEDLTAIVAGRVPEAAPAD